MISSMWRLGRIAALVSLVAAGAIAQTTQGLISGRVNNSQTGAPVVGATVYYENAATGVNSTESSNSTGNYFLPLLSPGFYRVRVTKDCTDPAQTDCYQAQEVHELELPVAARLELNFQMRPLNDVWEANQYRSVFLPGTKSIVTFYGPDVDSSRSGSFESAKARRGALETTISQVIDPAQVRDLPLAGRDVYTMLVTQPGVTADSGTARGLGLSVNGQRPSASGFMLDGLENNNYLVTGSLTPIAPEAIQEYRVSTNNFSAEYGRTSGFLANAVTRSGGNAFHGIGYWYLKNEALNANGFQENLSGIARVPAKERQLGYQVGGPVLKRRLFFSTAFEHLRSRSRQDTGSYKLPSTRFGDFTGPNSTARKLLAQYAAPSVTDRNNPTARIDIAPPVSVNRLLAIERVDYNSRDNKNRLMGRIAIARLSRPDFIWSPYPDFVSGLDQDTLSLAVNYTRSFRPGLIMESKLGRSTDNLGWDRAHPEVPTFAVSDDTVLPGSPAFYAYRNRNHTWEFLDSVVWTHGRHVSTFGGGMLLRSTDGLLSAGRDGQYLFDNIVTFALDRPRFLRASLGREFAPRPQQPDYSREYKYKQYHFFAQDTFKATARLVLNYGLRYEQFGAPRNTGRTKDLLVTLGQGGDFGQRLASAKLTGAAGSSGGQQLYGSDKNNFAIRAGFSYDPLGKGRTLVRGSYGIFYDRPFDNLWQNIRNNSIYLPTVNLPARATDFLAPVPAVLSGLANQVLLQDFPSLTMFDPGMRDAYSQSYFFGVQQQVRDNWSVEVNTLGSLARKLITTDIVNRQFTLESTFDSLEGRYNPNLPNISYRAGQGRANYNALSAVARYRGLGKMFQLAYTWSHSIDTQSEPLLGDFFDLSFSKISAGEGRGGRAAFSRQFDSRFDRGNSDFDQRHNLFFLSIWDVPRLASGSKAGVLFRDWKFSQLAAFRGGFPYSVIAPSSAFFGGGAIFNARANLLDPGKAILSTPQTVIGGMRVLGASGFGEPAPSRQGNTGRNAFRGPGLYNVDISISRGIPLRRLGEGGRLTVRADAFNFLNHANLNSPDSLLASDTFGIASFGRQGRQSGFPAVAPLNETSRQIQLILRVEF